MMLRVSLLQLVFLSFYCSTNVHAQSEFLEVLNDPTFYFRAALTFLRGRCWNFYSSSFAYPDMPNRDDYRDVIFDPRDVATVMPVQRAGPPQLQGLFFLDIPGDVPEVVTFAYTNEGGGLGQPLTGNPARSRQRIMSARNWAAATNAENAELITGSNDLQIVWEVRKGTAGDPEEFDIWVDTRLPFFCYRTTTFKCGDPFPAWSMVLENRPNTATSHPNFFDSFVWRRWSKFEGKESYYEAIQIVDATGAIIPAAWQHYMAKASRYGDMITKELNVPQAPPSCANAPFYCVVPIPLVCQSTSLF